MAVRPLPDEVKLNVTATGWDLLRRSLGFTLEPLVIPLDKPSQVNKIVGSSLLGFFSNQLERLEINYVLTDTFQIAIEPKMSRWLPLYLETPTILFKKGYAIVSPAKISPDSIYIEGPLNLVKNISSPMSLKLDERNLDEDFDQFVDVKFVNREFITKKPERVRVQFEVDKIITITDSLPVILKNIPPTVKHTVRLKDWHYSFTIPSKRIHEYTRDSVKAMVDLQGFSRGVIHTMPIVSGLPSSATVIQGDSVVIKF
jgi:hypothetical protein